MEISNTTAIVTGAASGLGRATATRLSAAGARVFGFDLGDAFDRAEPVEGVDAVGVDVTDTAAVDAAVNDVGDRVRLGAPLRILVNCAGVIGGSPRIISRSGRPTDPEAFARVTRVNLIGSYNVLAYAASLIAQTRELDHGQRGVIINTSSIAAFEGQVGQVAYSASKGGVVGMTLPAARDLAKHGIRVNSIAPGVVETPMIEGVPDSVRDSLAAGVPFPHRLARPEEFADLVVNVIEHDYINGETIRMDGALRMAPR